MMNLPINKIIHADCLEVMKELPDKCIDLVLTDPPYGIKAGGTFSKKGNQYTEKTRTMAAKRTYYKDSDWDNQTPSQDYFDEILRIGKKVVIFGGNYFTDKLPVTGKWIVWDKKIEEKYQNDFADVELVWTSEQGASKIIRFLWHGMIQQDMKNKEVRFHPTQKPIEVISQILNMFTEEGQIILDPFAGSCTTAVACTNLKRNYICIEKEEQYVKIGQKRVSSLTAQLF